MAILIRKKGQKCLQSVTSQVRLHCYCSQKFETIFKKTLKTRVLGTYISTIYTTHRIIFRYTVITDSPRLESISLRDIVFHILYLSRKRRDLQYIILDCFVHKINFLFVLSSYLIGSNVSVTKTNNGVIL
jgi:hypothetical protein